MTDNTALAAEQATGLRKLADMIEQNPNLPAIDEYTFTLNAFVDTPSEIRDMIRAGLAHGATVTKDAKGDTWFTATLAWGPVRLDINARREEVCERVVVDTKEIVEEVPDPDAVAALPKVTQTRVEEVVEWRCPSILAAADDKAALAGTAAAS